MKYHAINNGQRDPPSIMLKSEMVQSAIYYDITLDDIDEVKLIYGFGGFGSSQDQSHILDKKQISANKNNKLSNYVDLFSVLKSKDLSISVCAFL